MQHTFRLASCALGLGHRENPGQTWTHRSKELGASHLWSIESVADSIPIAFSDSHGLKRETIYCCLKASLERINKAISDLLRGMRRVGL